MCGDQLLHQRWKKISDRFEKNLVHGFPRFIRKYENSPISKITTLAGLQTCVVVFPDFLRKYENCPIAKITTLAGL